MHKISALLVTTWWGFSITIGYIVVPILFKKLPSPQIAGNTAAFYFMLVNYLTLIVCAALFLLERQSGAPLILALVIAALAAGFMQFVATPHIIQRDNLAFWHSASTVAYVVLTLAASYWLYTLIARMS